MSVFFLIIHTLSVFFFFFFCFVLFFFLRKGERGINQHFEIRKVNFGKEPQSEKNWGGGGGGGGRQGGGGAVC